MLEQILTTGGDERIDLLENGNNKYNLNPVKYKGVLTRGSCTGSPLNEESASVAESFLKSYDRAKHAEYAEGVRLSLKKLIQKDEDNFDVFLSPSGSDLCYYPLLFAKLLHPNKDIINYVTAPEELGTGSMLSLQGKVFGERSQFGEKLKKGSPIDPDLNVAHYFFTARNGHGEIEPYKERLVEEMNAENTGQSTIIGNLVIGSKSGIVDNITIIPRVSTATFWVVDVCQLRTPTKLINKLIKQNCMVLITGSKFYQAPPFCGALLVPKSISHQLQNVDEKITAPFKRFFAASDIPNSLPWLQKHFRSYENLGLLVRWTVALHEMQALNKVKTTDVIDTVERWHNSVIHALAKFPTIFELMPDSTRTNQSIVPFRIKNKQGEYYSEEKLKAFYEHMVSLPLLGFKGGYKQVALGQPVKYTGISFIRLALGSYNIRQILNGQHHLKDDEHLVSIIAQEAANF